MRRVERVRLLVADVVSEDLGFGLAGCQAAQWRAPRLAWTALRGHLLATTERALVTTGRSVGPTPVSAAGGS